MREKKRKCIKIEKKNHGEANSKKVEAKLMFSCFVENLTFLRYSIGLLSKCGYVGQMVWLYFLCLHTWSVCVLCAMMSSQPRGVLTLKRSKKRMQQWNGDGKSNKLQILWSLLGHKRSWLGLILKKSLNILLDMAFLLIKVRILDSKERSAGFV